MAKQIYESLDSCISLCVGQNDCHFDVLLIRNIKCCMKYCMKIQYLAPSCLLWFIGGKCVHFFLQFPNLQGFGIFFLSTHRKGELVPLIVNNLINLEFSSHKNVQKPIAFMDGLWQGFSNMTSYGVVRHRLGKHKAVLAQTQSLQRGRKEAFLSPTEALRILAGVEGPLTWVILENDHILQMIRIKYRSRCW